MAEYHIEIDPSRVVLVDAIRAAPTLTETKRERELLPLCFSRPSQWLLRLSRCGCVSNFCVTNFSDGRATRHATPDRIGHDCRFSTARFSTPLVVKARRVNRGDTEASPLLPEITAAFARRRRVPPNSDLRSRTTIRSVLFSRGLFKHL